MLPPVRAALSSHSDFQSQAPAAAARMSLAAATTTVAADNDKSVPISGGRMDALSLSAQLKLAQSFSIFAETIGKVLNMPRGENEALVDYATRLSEAVRALNPAERMSIERLLNQIVKGVTLRLLAEILNDPAGPDAARLAAYIETASASERDLAAKAVVSSYRQNGSAEPAANGNVSRPAPAAQGGMPAGAPAGAQGAATAAGAAPAASTPQSQAAPVASASQQGSLQDTPESSPARPDGQQPTQNTGNALADRQGNRLERPTTPASHTANPTMSGPASGQTAQQQAAAQIIPGQAAIAGASPNSPAGLGIAAADGDTGAAPAARIQDEAAADPRVAETKAKSPRLAETGMRAPSTDGRAGLSNARLMLAELANWMTGLVATGEASPTAGSTVRRPEFLAAPTEQPAGQDEPTAADGAAKQAAGTARNAGATDSPSAARPSEPPPSEAAAAAQPDGGEPLDKQMAMLAGSWPQATREGVPWPYVAYPPGEQEPEREERKARAIAEIGDEEDEAPAQDHGFHGEQQGEEAEQESSQDGEGRKDKAESAGEARSDEDEGRPNDLYWRMAGWS
ncbi:hypothetical protein N7E02_16080 [Aliirhizobium terrae]|uniref:hypothetical protein n=1 Tax=Terrirhizobium terrae TaxID=2926709 RepID=UPI002576EBF4|nr:hypothetical protein [Rhizobium sp. CC-CFT758]WJH41780.1 hypothetical protein N7E02_16080 [Rhizobium sp. CC-CFT758]